MTSKLQQASIFYLILVALFAYFGFTYSVQIGQVIGTRVGEGVGAAVGAIFAVGVSYYLYITFIQGR